MKRILKSLEWLLFGVCLTWVFYRALTFFMDPGMAAVALLLTAVAVFATSIAREWKQ